MLGFFLKRINNKERTYLIMKKVLRTTCLLLCLSYALPSTLAQVNYKLELLPDQATYQVSMIPDTTWTFPYNLTSSAQVTIRVPHGTGDYRFEVENLTSLVPETDWDNNARVDMPPEALAYDYLSFGLLNLGTNAYEYNAGVEVPMFTFSNAAVACIDSIQLINNDTDPFIPPNSYNANVGNALAVLGAGLQNAYDGNIGTGRALCTPEIECDSSVETEELFTFCEGESYQGMTFSNDTTLTSNYISYIGCDSIVTTQIIVLESDITEMYQIDCHSGINMPVRDTMTTTYTNEAGCDSVVIIYNETKPIFDTTIQVSLPEGLLYEGMIYENDTTFTTYDLTSFGCDSTVTVQITILDNPTTFVNVPLCEGDTFQGEVFVENTSLVDTIHLSNGVDSLIIHNIIIVPTYDETIQITLCDGASYQNVTYAQDTTLMEIYTTEEGCDSLISTEIIVMDGYELFQEIDICDGELFESVLYTQDTTFTKTYMSQGGCDSIIHTQLTVYPLPNAFISGKTEICSGNQTTLSVAHAASYEWSNGSTSSSIDVDVAGIYSVTVTNGEGCTSEASVELLVHDLQVSAFMTPIACDEFDAGVITFQSESPRPLLYSVTGGFGFSDIPLFENLIPGTYNLVAKDDSGCLWEDQLTIAEPEELIIDLGDDIYLQLGDSVAINALSNPTNFSLVEWSPADGLSCSDCATPVAQPLESTLFSVTVIDANGCEATDDIHIFVNREPRVYMPNAFSPDGDGINDLFMVYGGVGVQEINIFRIFDHWGSLVFEKEHFMPNDPTCAWNGKFREQEVQSGIFIYMIEVELADGSKYVMKGEIALVR